MPVANLLHLGTLPKEDACYAVPRYMRPLLLLCIVRMTFGQAQTAELGWVRLDGTLVPSSESTNGAVKYGGHDLVGFLQGRPNGLVNPFRQIGSGHLAHPCSITKKSITVLPGAPDAGSCRMVGQAGRNRRCGR